MNTRKIFIILIFLSILTPTAYAETTYDVMPKSGTSTQPILIIIRDTPITNDYKQYVYVFWDAIPVINRQLCVDLKNGEYEYRWDLSITPPKTANSYGKHFIVIWVETEFGLRKTLTYQYKITDGTPTTIEAWEQFINENPDFINAITGPKGDTGPIGPQGPRGANGEKGERGSQGTPGIQGNLGLQGVTGQQGTQGEPGAPAPPSTVIMASSFSAICSMMFTYYWVKREAAS